jgi:8-oxo-dGTP diphosphatase
MEQKRLAMTNERSSMPYTPILATLGYVFSPDRQRVLMIHRNARLDDAHLGKYNGLGGKLEAGEDVVSGLCREIREEAGITCQKVELAGTISWPGFGKSGEDWFGFIFRVLDYLGTPYDSNPEGTLEWIEVKRVSALPLWEGDRFFLPLIFDLAGPQFHGIMPYHNGRPISWSFQTLTNSGKH